MKPGATGHGWSRPGGWCGAVSAELACEGWWEWIWQWSAADDELLNWAKKGSRRVGSEQYYFV